jgi:hypothetical protein
MPKMLDEYFSRLMTQFINSLGLCYRLNKINPPFFIFLGTWRGRVAQRCDVLVFNAFEEQEKMVKPIEDVTLLYEVSEGVQTLMRSFPQAEGMGIGVVCLSG